MSVRIDPGMKDFAATTNGHVIGLDRHSRRLESDLAKAHRARTKERVRALHAKIKNSGKDQLHNFSTAPVKEYRGIMMGNVNA